MCEGEINGKASESLICFPGGGRVNVQKQTQQHDTCESLAHIKAREGMVDALKQQANIATDRELSRGKV